MADNKYSRGYRNDPYDRGGAGDSGPATDPLTELARLIGQSDPFAPDRNRQPDPRYPEAHPHTADWHADSAQQAQHYDAQHYDAQHYDPQHADPQRYEPGTHDDRYAAGEPQPYADHAHGSTDHYASYQNGYAYPQAGQHEAGYADASGYAQQTYHQDQQAYHQDPQAYQQEQPPFHQDQQAYQDQPVYPQERQVYAPDHEAPYFGPASDAPHQGEYGAAAAGPHTPVPGYPVPPFLGSDPNARPDEYYEDAPAPRRG